jgi:hypothetical protein
MMCEMLSWNASRLFEMIVTFIRVGRKRFERVTSMLDLRDMLTAETDDCGCKRVRLMRTIGDEMVLLAKLMLAMESVTNPWETM